VTFGGWLGPAPGGPAATALAVAVGVLLLLAGRRLFWLALGVLGCGLGFLLVQRLLGHADPTLALVVGLLVGAAGALLAVLVQKVAVVAAGALLGACGAANVAGGLGSLGETTEILVVVAGGLVGALLSLGVFSFALRLVTAAVGAALVTRAVPLPAELAAVLFATLWILGFVAQGTGRAARGRG